MITTEDNIGIKRLPIFYTTKIERNYELTGKLEGKELYDDYEKIKYITNRTNRGNMTQQYFEYYGVVLVPKYEAVQYFARRSFPGILFMANDPKGVLSRIFNDKIDDIACASIVEKKDPLPIEPVCFETIYECTNHAFVENTKKINSYFLAVYSLKDLERLDFIFTHCKGSVEFVIYPNLQIARAVIDKHMQDQKCLPIFDAIPANCFTNVIDHSTYSVLKYERT
jgi:hypothetical protein